MCDADYNDYDCCSSHNPCGIGGGDCDIDADCSGSLVCGVDNCQGFDSAWSRSNFDCCMSGKQFAKTGPLKTKKTIHGDWTKHRFLQGLRVLYVLMKSILRKFARFSN